MEKRHKEGYGLYVEDYDNRSNDKIANRPLLPNEYIIDVNGKDADAVFNEAIKDGSKSENQKKLDLVFDTMIEMIKGKYTNEKASTEETIEHNSAICPSLYLFKLVASSFAK